MSIRNLDKLFRPQSVAVIGASNRPDAVGHIIMKNMLAAGFEGAVMPVNPRETAIAGVLAFKDVTSLPVVPDLAVICTPPATVPEIIDQVGARGTKAAIVLTAGLDQQAMLDAARPHLLRILGHNCLGLLVPPAGLNASFAPGSLAPGKLAFASQSGALCTAVLDWAAAKDIGFSHFISLGNCADVDFGDVVDYLARDPDTSAILLYIESLTHARKFLSACRAASRIKPIVAIKSGRNAEGASAAASHTGALAGRDDVYDAAFKRAGVLRVDTMADLFDTVETLARANRLAGEDLVIVTNGGGLGVMAADHLSMAGGHLGRLSDDTKAGLDKVLPKTWSHGNPVDIIGDAPGKRYVDALDVLLDAPEVDALLVMHAPTGITSSDEVADGVIGRLKDTRKTVLVNWAGGRVVAGAREAFEDAGIPSYETPASAVHAFRQLTGHRRLQTLLMETPPAQPEAFTPDRDRARAVIDSVLADGRDLLTEVEAKELLDAYHIPIVVTRIAQDAEEAVALAEEIGFPVVVKILSREISHKSDVGGVALNLKSGNEVREAVETIQARVVEIRPDAAVDGYTVQQMISLSGAHELLIGAFVDDVFGPVIMFGQGGTAVEVVADRAVTLPPLNMMIAQRLMEETRVFKLLAGYRDRPAADLDAIKMTLLKVCQLVADFAEVAELDINPLLADDNGAIALDARVVVQVADESGLDRLAIRPYPVALEEDITTRSGETLRVRPIRPEDEPAYAEFFDHLEADDVRFRFFNLVKHPGHAFLARLTQIDYDRDMCFVAMRGDAIMGTVRAISDPDNERAEYAVIVRSDTKGTGLGYALMQKIIDYCRQRGTGEIFGHVLADNHAMRDMAEGLGFRIKRGPDPTVVEVVLPLNDQPATST
ncbi:MAG: GNAT family N-acetyltransferase [Alphaproteobacteria bacterium]